MKWLTLFRDDGLRGKVLRGTLLTGSNFGAQNALRLAGNLILTRLLFPEAFGLMAIVQVFMTGLNMFSQIGIRASIVQDSRGDDPVFLNTAWTIQIVRGVCLYIVVLLLAKPVATFYEAPILAEILPVTGLVALIQGFNSTNLATAHRNLVFGRMTVLTFSAQVAGLCLTIFLAFTLQSVWALVLGGLLSPTLICLFSHIILPGIRNSPCLDRASLSRLIGFGKYIFLSTIAGFVVNHADRAVLGKFITLEELALYGIAFFFASVPLLLLRRLNDNILFPLIVKRPPASDPRNAHKIGRTRFVLASGSMLLMAVPATFGILIIDLLYDPRYAGAGPLLVMIAIGQMPQLIIAGYANLALAAGESRRFAFIIVLLAILQLAALLLGVSLFGVIGAAFAPGVTGLLAYPAVIALTARYKVWTPGLDSVLFSAFCLFAVVAMIGNDDAWNLVISRF